MVCSFPRLFTQSQHLEKKDCSSEDSIGPKICFCEPVIGPITDGPVSVTVDELGPGGGILTNSQQTSICELTRCMARARGRHRHCRELVITGRSNNVQKAYDLAWRILEIGDEAIREFEQATASQGAASSSASSDEWRWPPHLVQAELLSSWKAGFEVGRLAVQREQFRMQPAGPKQ